MDEEKSRVILSDYAKQRRQAKAQWTQENKEYLLFFIDYLTRLQTRRILHYELIFSVVGLGLMVNIFSSPQIIVLKNWLMRS